MREVTDRTSDTVLVVNAFRRIMRRLRLAAGETQSALGISAAQLYVLRQLTGGEALSISELADRTLTDRSSVAAVVEKLVARRLVARSTSRDDRRRAEVRITTKGQRVLNAAAPAPTTLLVSALERLPASELQLLARGLSQLVTEMGLATTPPSMLFEDELAR
jgi:DNA-binding MarR family transcriptional regulator